MFREFSSLSPTKLDAVRRQITKLLSQKRYTLASNVCLEWISTAVDGLMYYHRYERTFLTVFVVLTFVFWQFYVLKLILPTSKINENSSFDEKIDKKYLFAVVFTIFYLLITSQPLMYFVYCILPIFLIYSTRKSLKNSLGVLFGSCRSFFGAIFLLVAIEILVFTFFYRISLIIGLILMSIWSLFKHVSCPKTKKLWIFACISNCIFPLLPTVGQSVSYGVVASSALMIGGSFYGYSTYRNFKSNGLEFRRTYLSTLSSVCLICVSFVVLLTSASVEAKHGSPLFSRLFSWIVLLASPILPLFNEKTIKIRCSSIALSFSAPFALMSVSYETFFLILLTVLLYSWMKIEEKMDINSSSLTDDDQEFGIKTNTTPSTNGGGRPMEFDDFRRAYVFVFFILLAFFGTGNIASLNSFNPSFVYCFVTVFSPFIMASLLVIKIIIPFLFVCTSLRILETISPSCSTGSLFWIVVLISDLMAFVSFHLIIVNRCY